MNAGEERPAAFLDRDGTLIAEKNYLSDPGGVVLLSGVIDSLRALGDAGFLLVVVTNQSGIARGLYAESDYRAVEARLDQVLAAGGVTLDGTYHCPHHPRVTGACSCRKPDTGMYLEAARDHGIALRRSYFVGDRVKDVVPARALGGTGVLVRTGYGREHERELPGGFHVADDLPAAVKVMLGSLPLPLS